MTTINLVGVGNRVKVILAGNDQISDRTVIKDQKDFEVKKIPAAGVTIVIKDFGALVLPGYTGFSINGVAVTSVNIDAKMAELFPTGDGLSLGYTEYNALISHNNPSDPNVTELGTNTIGAIVWTRDTDVRLVGTLAGAFPANATFFNPVYYKAGTINVEVKIARVDNDTIELIAVDADDLINIYVKIQTF